MADLIIAFPKLDDAKNLRKLLVRNGYDVNMVCDSGAQIVGAVNELDGGIIISKVFSKSCTLKGMARETIPSKSQSASFAGDASNSILNPFGR